MVPDQDRDVAGASVVRDQVALTSLWYSALGDP